MRLSSTLVSGSALICGASAFFPYQPIYECGTLDNPCPEPAKRDASYPALASEQGGGSFSLKLARRKRNLQPKSRFIKERGINNYDIAKSSTPTEPNSVAIDQDGKDYSYFAVVGVGSSNQQLYILMDTGASDSWIMSDACTSSACNKHNTFSNSSSSSFSPSTSPFNVGYGSGDVAGSYVSDNIRIAGLTVPLRFGMATTVSNDFNSFPVDGILGLSKSSTQIAFIQALSASKQLSSNIFSINLSRGSDATQDGEITFGGTDPSKFSGSLSYTAVKADSNRWEIAVDGAALDGTVQASGTGKTAIIDTGTSFCFLPASDAAALHRAVGGVLQGSTYTVPCSTTAELQFGFSGLLYSLKGEDWIHQGSDGKCYSNIFPSPNGVVDDNQWLLGDTFLKNVYVVFDVDNSRVGFGSKNGSPTPIPQSALHDLTSSIAVTIPSSPSISQSASITSSSMQVLGSTATSTMTSPEASTATSATSPTAQVSAVIGMPSTTSLVQTEPQSQTDTGPTPVPSVKNAAARRGAPLLELASSILAALSILAFI